MDTHTAHEFWTRKSWVGTANDASLGFPLQSLPYCSFVPKATPDTVPHLGVGIGTFVLDLDTLSRVGLLNSLAPDVRAACTAPQLNCLMFTRGEAFCDVCAEAVEDIIDLYSRPAE